MIKTPAKKLTAEQRFRSTIQSIIKELIDEMSATGDIAGYEIPGAFSGGRKKKTKQNSEKLGYKLVWKPEDGDTKDLKVPKKRYDIPKLSESRSAYHDFKADESLSPRQKVGHSLRLVRRSLSEAEKLIDMNLRLKEEAGLQSKDYWKRTHTALTKIDERLVRIINKVKNFRD